MSYEDLKTILEKNKQSHILSNYNLADDNTKKILEEQINRIDFEQINGLYETTKDEVSFENDVIEPIKYIDKEKLSKEEDDKYLTLGENAIKNGKYSVVTMAGGQGTRL